jgi:sugar-specific transcriptional regulator TrmB
MLVEDLIELGLARNEAKVYLALLDLGPTTTGPLIKKTKLYRVIIYDTLEKLLQQGLVNYSMKKNVKHFEAEKPTQILEIIKNKEILAKSVVNNLQKLQSNKPIEQGAFVYEGWKGIKAAQENYFKIMKKNAGGEYLMVGASQKLH